MLRFIIATLTIAVGCTLDGLNGADGGVGELGDTGESGDAGKLGELGREARPVRDGRETADGRDGRPTLDGKPGLAGKNAQDALACVLKGDILACPDSSSLDLKDSITKFEGLPGEPGPQGVRGAIGPYTGTNPLDPACEMKENIVPSINVSFIQASVVCDFGGNKIMRGGRCEYELDPSSGIKSLGEVGSDNAGALDPIGGDSWPPQVWTCVIEQTDPILPMKLSAKALCCPE